MRKQVDFSFRVFEYHPREQGKTTADNSEYIRRNYLDQGWEVLSTEIVQVTSDGPSLGVTLVKYEEVGSVTPPAVDVVDTESSVKRGPGRPPKNAE